MEEEEDGPQQEEHGQSAFQGPETLGGEAPPAGTAPTPQLLRGLSPDLLRRVASLLPRNEVAFGLRLVSKGFASVLSGPEHTTVRLSEPVPTLEFARHWAGLDALRTLTAAQREQLPLKTAHSGVVANLEVLRLRGDLWQFCTCPFEAARLLEVAAGAGQVQLCHWLRSQLQSQPHSPSALLMALVSAARGGHMAVCEWLLAEPDACPMAWCVAAATAAAQGGHAEAVQLLMQRARAAEPGAAGQPAWSLGPDRALALLVAAAVGCSQVTLMYLYDTHAGSALAGNTRGKVRAQLIAAAAGSSAPDWRDKVTWVQAALGGEPHEQPVPVHAFAAAGRADGHERLAWLLAVSPQDKLHPEVLCRAAVSGSVATLRFVLAHVRARGGVPDAVLARAAQSAARRGCLECLQALCAEAHAQLRHERELLVRAAEGSHLHVLAWLVGAGRGEGGDGSNGGGSDSGGDRNGNGNGGIDGGGGCSGSGSGSGSGGGGGDGLDAGVLNAAAGSGSAEALAWLLGRGCPWDGSTFDCAAAACSEECLAWLLQRGVPAAPGRVYLAAAFRHDRYMLRALRRLGVDGWGPRVLLQALEAVARGSGGSEVRLLLDAGCPVDWGAMEAEARRLRWLASGCGGVQLVAWVRELRRAHERCARAQGAGGGVGGSGAGGGGGALAVGWRKWLAFLCRR